MRKTLKIAKLELSILFYSPVAWLVLIIFIIQSGTRFFGMFGGYQEAMAMGNPVNDLTFAMFPGTNGLFDQTLQNIYLYIPLLTMGLMSREISSGSIKLLLSSPVKIRSIIFGKYLAIMTYGFLLMVVLGSYSLAGLAIIKDADTGLILSGLTGLFLLTCTYAAIGLFMSSLSSYQVVAAISTLAVFAMLQYIGGVGQDIDFIRDLTYYLSLSGRADDMLKGLLNSKDILYFVLIIGLFLCLSILRLRASRTAKHWSFQLGVYTMAICTVLLGVYVSSRPQFICYLDATQHKTRTLTPNSQAIAKQIKGPLRMTTYVNLLDQHVYTGLPASRNLDLSRFDGFRRFIPGLELNYVYYYDITDLKENNNMIYQGDLTGLTIPQIAEKVAENMGLDLGDFMPPAEIRKRINLKPEDNSLVRVLEYQGRTSMLRLYNEMDPSPSEAEISAAIKRLLVNPTRVVFINGHHERSIVKTGDRNYQLMTTMKKARKALVNQGFDVSEVDLSKEALPSPPFVLVLADPATALGAAEQQQIKTYLDKGGDMLITGEPGRQDILNPILRSIGIQLQTGMLVMPTKDNAPDLIMATAGPGGGAVAMPGAAAMSYDPAYGFQADTLLISPAAGWNTNSAVDLTTTELSYLPAAGDRKGAFPTAMALSRTVNGKAQRIFIAGDADFMDNAELKHARGMNLSFTMSLFKWFSKGEFPIDTSRPAPSDDDILLNKRQISSLKLIFIGLLPGLIALLGASTLILRKRN
ncbi:ABC transporter, permease protein, putative [Pedobacter sp. BAL39]|uniref:Gldg family protein n=1 Tax=Pedobacter sp. BAL39 TaxID=391596 RepID=UPI00015594E3|nr:Gldg family protein [Pedobacter sp. BAL39]EDM37520.1 ABC transporter, permease protein, putative [Pedobacter sp. BAL39]